MAAPTGIVGRGLRLLRRPTEGQRQIERATKRQRAYDKGVVKGAGTGAVAGGGAGAAAASDISIEDVIETVTGVPKETFVQKEARSSDNTSSKMKNTVRDIKGTPAETPEKISKETYKRKPTAKESKEAREGKLKKGGKVAKKAKGGKIGRGCGAAMRGGGKVMR